MDEEGLEDAAAGDVLSEEAEFVAGEGMARLVVGKVQVGDGDLLKAGR